MPGLKRVTSVFLHEKNCSESSKGTCVVLLRGGGACREQEGETVSQKTGNRLCEKQQLTDKWVVCAKQETKRRNRKPEMGDIKHLFQGEGGNTGGGERERDSFPAC